MSNSETDNFDDEYFELVSEYGKSAFVELISNVSRQRQTNLLISAVITILLSFSIVGNVETEFFGLKFTFIDIKIIPGVTGAVCLYFLSTYLVGVFQDWQQTRFSTLPIRINILNLSNKISLARLERANKSAALMKEISENMEQTLQARSEIFKEINELEKRQQAEVEEAKKNNPNSPGFSASLLIRKHELERRPLYEKLKNFSKENDLQLVAKKTKSHLRNTSLEGKSRLLDEALSKYQILSNINVIIQIIFPSLLAVFAIGSAIWKFWH